SGFSMSASAGTAVGLFGPNGAGKSVALAIMAGLVIPTTGEVRVLGRPPRAAAASGALGAWVHGSGFPGRARVGEFMLYLARLQAIRDPRGAALAALAGVGGMPWRSSRFCDLSAGMVKRVGIAQAMMGDPRVVLLDEPTDGLDAAGMSAIEGLLAARRPEALLLVASHDRAWLEKHCEEVLSMESGRVVSAQPTSH
ncbi:MAG: ATP-binding cassette domain-containing protein, partial [Polyangiaceae bacterium]